MSIQSVKEDTTVLTCANGHPLWVSIEQPAAVVYYDQEEGVTGRLYRSKHSEETKPEIAVLCTTGNCKVGRYEDREMRRMLERTPR